MSLLSTIIANFVLLQKYKNPRNIGFLRIVKSLIFSFDYLFENHLVPEKPLNTEFYDDGVAYVLYTKDSL